MNSYFLYLDSNTHVLRGKVIHLVKDVSPQSSREVPTHAFIQMASERQSNICYLGATYLAGVPRFIAADASEYAASGDGEEICSCRADSFNGTHCFSRVAPRGGGGAP